MAQAEFNASGTPLIAFGRSFMLTTTGAPSTENPNKQVSKVTPDLDDFATVGDLRVANWGSSNNFPQLAEDIIGKTGVLNTGLKFIRNFTLGQGVFPCKITGFDADGNEQMAVVNDPAITSLLTGRMVRRYMANALRDYFKFGVAFPELIPNADGSKIVGINTVNAMFARYAEKKNGVIPSVVVSGKWPDTPSATSDYSVVPLLDMYDPQFDLEAYRLLNKAGGRTFMYPLRDEWSNNEYFPLPIWWSAYRAGWIGIANKIPAFLLKMYENQVTIKWHIQIPYVYWEKRYPENDFKTKAERQKAIQDEMDSIEENLVGEANANKALFTMFEMNPSGKVEEQWIITPLDAKTKADENLIASAAANSEILFSLMINPNVFGAGMPGGTYAGNQGGSNIREAFLVNIALAWLDRQNILDPIEAMLRYNGVQDVELRFRNTILTTLDTGAGTTKVAS
jgi:hypothetical protein